MKVLFIECHNGKVNLDWIRDTVLHVDPSAEFIPFINTGNQRLLVFPRDMDIIITGTCCGRSTLNAQDMKEFDDFTVSGGYVIKIDGYARTVNQLQKHLEKAFVSASRTIKFYRHKA